MVRPKSARAHADVLDAAMRLFAERGIDATSMDAIADTSGVSKATIYKHWQDKDALLMEVMLRATGRDTAEPTFDSGDLREDLIAAISHEPPQEYAGLRERLMPHLMAYAARNPTFGNAWRTRVIEPPREQLLRVLHAGIANGQLPGTLDTEVAIAMLFGPIMYGHITKVLLKKSPELLPERIVDAFLKSFLQSQERQPTRRSAGKLVSGSTQARARTPRRGRFPSTD
jgi:AcrR family transcriptional regulator